MKNVCKRSEQSFLYRLKYILYALPDITAVTIVLAIHNTLAQLNLALNKARGHHHHHQQHFI